jgi:hypothetical protein
VQDGEYPPDTGTTRCDCGAHSEAWPAIYGPKEAAELLGLTLNTFHQRRHRKKLPEPRCVISGVPLWSREDLVP